MEEPVAKCARVEEEIYVVLSADGEETRWPRQTALRAGTLKDWVDDTGGQGKFPTPLSTTALRTLCTACAHEGEEATSLVASLPFDEATELLRAAHFLEATGAMMAAAQHLMCTLVDVEHNMYNPQRGLQYNLQTWQS